jgi:dihydrofolate synthase / folylpolyglutamate synthase
VALTYDRLVSELFPRLTGGIRWGLERTHRMLASVGDPQLRYPCVHVGGTNGKGSVAASTASILTAAGQRVGLYSSPHLVDFRERFRIDGTPISEAAVLSAADRLWPAIEAENPSFFEATTALGFLLLADAGVDVAVIEVGLGGRLDSTNVIEPAVVALTNVDFDHMQYLGNTLEAIATEKAGILKPGVAAITGAAEGAALDVFRQRAREIGAPLAVLAADAVADIHVGLDGTRFRLRYGGYGELTLATPLIGAHQARNAALAVALCDALPAPLRPDAEAVAEGLRSVRWPGRFQVVRRGGTLWVFDVAHNVAGAAALTRTVQALALPRPLTTIVGVLGDKDWRGMLLPLYDESEFMILTVPPSAPAERRWDADMVVAELGLERARVAPDFAAGLDAAGRTGGTVLVTGSFHTVGDALLYLGIPF